MMHAPAALPTTYAAAPAYSAAPPATTMMHAPAAPAYSAAPATTMMHAPATTMMHAPAALSQTYAAAPAYSAAPATTMMHAPAALPTTYAAVPAYSAAPAYSAPMTMMHAPAAPATTIPLRSCSSSWDGSKVSLQHSCRSMPGKPAVQSFFRIILRGVVNCSSQTERCALNLAQQHGRLPGISLSAIVPDASSFFIFPAGIVPLRQRLHLFD